MSSWINEEFNNIEFNDERLNRRFLKLAGELSENPSFSIQSASLDWAATKAAYRFFDNSKVTSSSILEPHFHATACRSSNYQRVIIAQDTTYIDYTSHKKTKNLGKTGKNKFTSIKGLCMHSGLVLTEKGLPLGLSYNHLWNRNEVQGTDHKRSMTPIQLKESYRWIDCIKKSRELLSVEEIIIVCDREADIHEVYEEAINNNVDLVVRSQHNRIRRRALLEAINNTTNKISEGSKRSIKLL